MIPLQSFDVVNRTVLGLPANMIFIANHTERPDNVHRPEFSDIPRRNSFDSAVTVEAQVLICFVYDLLIITIVNSDYCSSMR